MSVDQNPYRSPAPDEPLSRDRPSRKWLCFPVALELLVVLAIVITLFSLLVPLIG